MQIIKKQGILLLGFNAGLAKGATEILKKNSFEVHQATNHEGVSLKIFLSSLLIVPGAIIPMNQK